MLTWLSRYDSSVYTTMTHSHSVSQCCSQCCCDSVAPAVTTLVWSGERASPRHWCWVHGIDCSTLSWLPLRWHWWARIETSTIRSSGVIKCLVPSDEGESLNLKLIWWLESWQCCKISDLYQRMMYTGEWGPVSSEHLRVMCSVGSETLRWPT